MESLHDAGYVHEAQKHDVELVIAGGHTANHRPNRLVGRAGFALSLRWLKAVFTMTVAVPE